MYNSVSLWPEIPALPPVGRFALIRIRTACPREQARSLTRTVLREVLAAWNDCLPDDIALRETPHGPVWEGLLEDPCVARPSLGTVTGDAHRRDTRSRDAAPTGAASCAVKTGSAPPEQSRLAISLAYEDDEAWIALRRGGLIGLDVMHLRPVPEAELVAHHYFGPSGLAALQQSSDSVRDFALAWTALEACGKCFREGLREWSPSSTLQTQSCTNWGLIVKGGLALSVVTAPWPGDRTGSC